MLTQDPGDVRAARGVDPMRRGSQSDPPPPSRLPMHSAAPLNPPLPPPCAMTCANVRRRTAPLGRRLAVKRQSPSGTPVVQWSKAYNRRPLAVSLIPSLPHGVTRGGAPVQTRPGRPTPPVGGGLAQWLGTFASGTLELSTLILLSATGVRTSIPPCSSVTGTAGTGIPHCPTLIAANRLSLSVNGQIFAASVPTAGEGS